MLEFLRSLVVNEGVQHTQGNQGTQEDQDIQENQGNQHFKTGNPFQIMRSFISSISIAVDPAEYMLHSN
jgi:hypothetical protein